MYAHLKAEIAKLCEQAGSARAITSPIKLQRYIPLSEQIHRLIKEMPPELRQRSWSITELAMQLKGRYRAHPHPQQIAKELLALGWHRSRVWTSEGRGSRIWHPPV